MPDRKKRGYALFLIACFWHLVPFNLKQVPYFLYDGLKVFTVPHDGNRITPVG